MCSCPTPEVRSQVRLRRASPLRWEPPPWVPTPAGRTRMGDVQEPAIHSPRAEHPDRHTPALPASAVLRLQPPLRRLPDLHLAAACRDLCHHVAAVCAVAAPPHSADEPALRVPPPPVPLLAHSVVAPARSPWADHNPDTWAAKALRPELPLRRLPLLASSAASCGLASISAYAPTITGGVQCLLLVLSKPSG